jgi:2-desacetyl-2-hydroxyethyl bacteriochlorophyllide A dehydrogenase
LKAIVNTGPGKIEMQDLRMPEPGPGQVRIRTAACAICATDMEMIGGWTRTSFPAIPGHEWSGWVDAVGKKVSPALLMQPCVAENVLANGDEVGFEQPGGYAEFFLTSAQNVHTLPADMPLDTAALIEPLAVVVRGIRRLGLRDRSHALVLGDGPIGLLTVLLLKKIGVRDILVVGGREARLKLAVELGALRTCNYHHASKHPSAYLEEELGGTFSHIVEASGSAAGLESALNLAKREGKILILGDYGQAASSFRWNHLLHQELELIGSNASAGAWPEAVKIAISEQARLRQLITHRMPVARFMEGFHLMRERNQNVIKTVLTWRT